MSKAALYKGIGAGLGLLAQNIHADQQRQAEEAAEIRKLNRRADQELSLAQLKRKWGLEDEAVAHQNAIDRIQIEADLDLETSKAARDYELANPTLTEQAQAENYGASAEQARATADYNTARAEQARAQTERGLQGDPTALMREMPQRLVMQAHKEAADMAPGYFRTYADEPPKVETLIRNHPGIAERLGIKPGESLDTAMAKVQDALFFSTIERYSDQYQPAQQGLLGDVGGQVSMEELDQLRQPAPPPQQPGADQIISGGQPLIEQRTTQRPQPTMDQPPGSAEGVVADAMAAIQQGAPPDAVIRKMEQMGVPPSVIEQVKQRLQ